MSKIEELVEKSHGKIGADKVHEKLTAMGFDGKSLIHPRQIDICNAAFSPSADEIAWATKVRDAFAGGDGGVTEVDGKMVEALHLSKSEAGLIASATSPTVDDYAMTGVSGQENVLFLLF